MRRICIFVVLFLAQTTFGQTNTALRDALVFHASFDRSADADFAKGDAKMYTAKSLRRKSVRAGLHSKAVHIDRKQGKFLGSLVFTKKTSQIVFYKGAGNLPKARQGFQGSFCLWLRLSPSKDLPPGFVDPLQITDKKWNDASFFLDFTKKTPRKFRLGVFSDFKFWNPKSLKYDKIPESQRPLVTVSKPPFSRQMWTHVGITFRQFNHKDQDGMATLYLNGKSQGQLKRKQRFTWNKERVGIMLGINYVGQFDDFAIFKRALTAQEMTTVYHLPKGIGSLR
jgi:hypothetical protein